MTSYRRSYQSDPRLVDRVFDLLEITFPGVSTGRRNALSFGAPWERASTPFVVQDENRVLAHVGLLPLPLRIMGEDLLIGGVHGVATHPDHRRRGHFRALLEELIRHAEPIFPALVLTTLHPEYFEAFGFRVIPEWVARAVPDQPGAVPTRRLDLSTAGDLALLHRLIERRCPVSHHLGVGTEKCCFGFVEYRTPIVYSDPLDVAVVGERAGSVLRVYDVIGSRIPALDELVAIWGEPVEQVLLFLTADRIAGQWRVEPHDLSGGPESLSPGEANWVMMARGPFAAEGAKVMLPRPARC